MDEKRFNELIDNISSLENIVNSYKENNTKVLMYLVNKTNELKDELTMLSNDKDNINSKISAFEKSFDAYKKETEELLAKSSIEIETKANEAISKLDIAKIKRDIANLSQLEGRVNKLESSVLDKENYVIIKIDDFKYNWLAKLKNTIYVLFHYRKIKKQEQERLELIRQQEEEEKRIAEKKRIEEEIRKNEEKLKKEEEIRNILKVRKK